MNKTINAAEVKELSMDVLAFVSGGCNHPLEVEIDNPFEPGPPSGKNPESDYPNPVFC